MEGMSKMMQFSKSKNVIPLALILLLVIVSAGCGSKGSLDQSPELNLKFGLEAAKGGLWKEALLRWENGLKLSPNNPKLHNNLAIAYENEGEYTKAEEHYKKALELDPTNEVIKINYNGFKGFLKNLDIKPIDKAGEIQNADKK
jgi:Tfp pilus assembly protein PilF